MAISRLSLSDFRNHADALIAPQSAMVVLTGENGAGKTNILEAVSLLAPGRGLRGAALGDMARQNGAGGFAISARIGDLQIGTGTDARAPERRQVRVDGRQVSASSLAGLVALSWLTPAMDRLFLESAGGRRRFLDRLVLAIHPSHGMHATRYEAAMRSRNNLLADDAPADPAWLAALEAQMAEHGAQIDVARRALVERLSAHLAGLAEGPFARPDLALDGWSGNEADLELALRESRPRDRAAGRTLMGPHRADLLVTHAAKGQSAGLCSTGEQKALLLGLILAHAEIARGPGGRPLLILLDEVAAHLDPVRRTALFDRLRATGGQVWMTGTEPSLFEGLGDATRLHVENGRVDAV
jgi:DNA replication and repair protein RecF